MELHPTGEVTEYTATVAYELLREGEEGRQKVDSVKFILRAEGSVKCEKTIFPSYYLCSSEELRSLVEFYDINLWVGQQQVQRPLKPEQS